MSTDRAEIETLLLKHQVESTEHRVRLNLQNIGSGLIYRTQVSNQINQRIISRCCYYIASRALKSSLC